MRHGTKCSNKVEVYRHINKQDYIRVNRNDTGRKVNSIYFTVGPRVCQYHDDRDHMALVVLGIDLVL